MGVLESPIIARGQRLFIALLWSWRHNNNASAPTCMIARDATFFPHKHIATSQGEALIAQFNFDQNVADLY